MAVACKRLKAYSRIVTGFPGEPAQPAGRQAEVSLHSATLALILQFVHFVPVPKRERKSLKSSLFPLYVL